MLAPHRESAELTDPLELVELPGGQNWDGKIAYLDRDGVINVGSENYVNSPAEVELLPNAGLAIGNLRRAGYRIVVVTNQSPIGRGHWDSDNLDDIHSELRNRLLIAPLEGAWARKPNSGMLEAGRQLVEAASNNVDFTSMELLFDAEWVERPDESTSFMVGDRGVDMAAAENFGVRGIRCDPNIGISGVVDSILGGTA